MAVRLNVRGVVQANPAAVVSVRRPCLDEAVADKEEAYEPDFRAYDRGVGTLHVRGELRGHLASLVGETTTPSHQRCVWLVIIWLDGQKEDPLEDHGPDWAIVRELDAGYLDDLGPSIWQTHRFWWRKFYSVTPGPPCVYDFAWLPEDEAASMWTELGISVNDF